MSGHEVSIYALSDPETPFDIEGIAYFFGSKVCDLETLLHREEFIVLETTRSDRHTGTIMSDTLSFTEYFTEGILYAKYSFLNFEYSPLMLDDSRKHRND